MEEPGAQEGAQGNPHWSQPLESIVCKPVHVSFLSCLPLGQTDLYSSKFFIEEETNVSVFSGQQVLGPPVL